MKTGRQALPKERMELQRAAQFDQTGQYRYWLTRDWDFTKARVAFVMLNPSRADHQQDDPTLRRCIRFSQAWKYGSLVVVNLFAYCTASPKALKSVDEPIGQGNDTYILEAARVADAILLAWGNGGNLEGRDRQVLELLKPYRDRLYCLGWNSTGQPKHPLYLPKNSKPIPWVKG